MFGFAEYEGSGEKTKRFWAGNIRRELLDINLLKANYRLVPGVCNSAMWYISRINRLDFFYRLLMYNLLRAGRMISDCLHYCQVIAVVVSDVIL